MTARSWPHTLTKALPSDAMSASRAPNYLQTSSSPPIHPAMPPAPYFLDKSALTSLTAMPKHLRFSCENVKPLGLTWPSSLNAKWRLPELLSKRWKIKTSWSQVYCLPLTNYEGSFANRAWKWKIATVLASIRNISDYPRSLTKLSSKNFEQLVILNIALTSSSFSPLPPSTMKHLPLLATASLPRYFIAYQQFQANFAAIKKIIVWTHSPCHTCSGMEKHWFVVRRNEMKSQ